MVEKFIAIKYYAKYSTHTRDIKPPKSNFFIFFAPPVPPDAHESTMEYARCRPLRIFSIPA